MNLADKLLRCAVEWALGTLLLWWGWNLAGELFGWPRMAWHHALGLWMLGDLVAYRLKQVVHRSSDG